MGSTAKRNGSPSPSRERMARHRERKRSLGMRQVQLWVPDLRQPDVLAEYQRQARLIAAADPAGDDAMDWIGQLYEWPDFHSGN